MFDNQQKYASFHRVAVLFTWTIRYNFENECRHQRFDIFHDSWRKQMNCVGRDNSSTALLLWKERHVAAILISPWYRVLIFVGDFLSLFIILCYHLFIDSPVIHLNMFPPFVSSLCSPVSASLWAPLLQQCGSPSYLCWLLRCPRQYAAVPGLPGWPAPSSTTHLTHRNRWPETTSKARVL